MTGLCWVRPVSVDVEIAVAVQFLLCDCQGYSVGRCGRCGG